MEKLVEGLFIADIRAAQNLDLLVENVIYRWFNSIKGRKKYHLNM
jgi:hypothetical protein